MSLYIESVQHLLNVQRDKYPINFKLTTKFTLKDGRH